MVTASPVHAVFDLAAWASRFDLATVRKERQAAVLEEYRSGRAGYDSEAMLRSHLRNSAPAGEQVVGPAEMAILEQLRTELNLRTDGVVPTDVFIWAVGTAANRAMTSVGQLPYWPSSREWPTASDGGPLQAVGQLSFVDSIDLVADLPGEILVFFVGASGADPGWDQPVVEWVSRSEGHPLEFAPPGVVVPLRPAYGVRHRTFDIELQDGGRRNDRLTKSVAIIEGTKIGGLPRWIQGRPRKRQLGRFIGCMGSIVPQITEPFPFINTPSRADVPGGPELDLSWGDAGTVYVFESAGQTSTLVQFY